MAVPLPLDILAEVECVIVFFPDITLDLFWLVDPDITLVLFWLVDQWVQIGWMGERGFG